MGGQLLIGLDDGLAIDDEVAGEIARAWQRIARRPPAALDLFDDRLRNSQAKAAAPFGTDDEVRNSGTKHGVPFGGQPSSTSKIRDDSGPSPFEVRFERIFNVVEQIIELII
ncbi:MAG: hypothetical protein ACREC1_03485 [Methylovirgula sp.]